MLQNGASRQFLLANTSAQTQTLRVPHLRAQTAHLRILDGAALASGISPLSRGAAHVLNAHNGAFEIELLPYALGVLEFEV